MTNDECLATIVALQQGG